MAAHLRAEKSGYAREVQKRLKSKFDPVEAAKALRWIRALAPSGGVEKLPTSITDAVAAIPGETSSVEGVALHGYLKSGLVFGHVLASLDAAEAKRVASTKTWKVSENLTFEATKERERIGIFLNFALRYGVASTSIFQTDQLYENTNMTQVVCCLTALGVAAQARTDYAGPPDFWPHRHTENRRTFTEEQLRVGAATPCLWSLKLDGSCNTGAHFGAKRHITDIH